MKMVRVGDKMVPEFAADGKGSNDLKKAMYGAMMKRAQYGTQIGKKLMMSGGEVMRYAENGTKIENGRVSSDKFFIARGFDNRGDDPTGKEHAFIMMRTEEGVKNFTPMEILEMYPEYEGDITKFYQDAGIEYNVTKSQDGRRATTFPQLQDGRYNQRLRNEFGVDDMDQLREKLNIAPVNYERDRDLPKLVPGMSGRDAV